MKLSVVIPVYNEERTIKTILNMVNNAINELSFVDDYELVIVDDCSQDSSYEILQNKAKSNHRIKLFKNEVNKGKGASLTEGFSHCSGDVVIIQDADLEYDPFEYSKLLGPILKGKADVVFGSRFKGETGRVLYYWHRLANMFLTQLSNMFTNINLTDMETCYKVFKREIIQNMILESSRFGIEPEMTAKVSKVKNISIYEVTISYYGRTYEEGKKIGWKDGISALYCIMKYNLFTDYKNSFTCDQVEMEQYLSCNKNVVQLKNVA